MPQLPDYAAESVGTVTRGHESDRFEEPWARRLRRRLREPATALIAAAVFLPILLFGLAAWQTHRESLRRVETRVERTARVLEEHALKVFETHRLVIEQINIRMRFMDWSREADRKDIHLQLKRLQDGLDQIATLTIVDAEGRMRASGRIYPADPKIGFADRDWFKYIKTHDQTLPYVSKSYRGRTSGLLTFNLVARAVPAKDGAFDGAIAVSVDRGYFERFYQSIERTFDYTVDLVRDDGQVLARTPSAPASIELPAGSLLKERMSISTSGLFTGVSRFDGVERIYAYRKISGYPVFVRFGISVHSGLMPWRKSLIGYGIVAALASLALMAVSLLALRQTDRERLARRRWEETAAALQAEAAQRGKVEEQLRQSQKMEAVGRLTGGVAHDFNNLLTAVIGSLDLVRRRSDKIDPRTLGLVTNALEGAQRAAVLTSRLLAFSRQQPLQPEQLDANALVAGMSDLLARTLGETIAIETALRQGLWPGLCDPNQLESAVLNLAVNARDAMPDGGRLRIATENVHVEPGTSVGGSELTPGEFVMIAVSDTGTGMPPAVLENIFEPFFTTKPVGKGTGLGLSQVYGFVQQSGGQLAVESEVGHGTTFRIYLPRAQPEEIVAPIPAATKRVSPRLGHGETILVVEDEPMVRDLSVATLEDAGYRVVSAGEGRAALDLFRGNPSVALVFTDVVLGGGMNGRELARLIQNERPDLPVLFTSGYSGDAIVHGGRLDAGIVLISKPFTSDVLLAKIGELLAAAERSPARLVAL